MYRYRRIHAGLTYEQYKEEPDSTVDWDIAFENMEHQMEAEAIKKAAKAMRDGGR
jgi:hypothetical protein